MIADAEKIVGAFLREHADVVALDANVAGRTPSSITKPWIRVTQLDAADAPSGHDHLVDYLLQLDCYAGQEAMKDHTGQAAASTLARTARAALKELEATSVEDVVVSEVQFTSMARIPDTDFEPAHERFILDTRVRLHAVPA